MGGTARLDPGSRAWSARDESPKKGGGRSRPREKSEEGLEGDLEGHAEEPRAGLRGRLEVVRVVRAGASRRGRAVSGSGLDARLTVEGAARVRDETGAGVEGVVDLESRLTVDHVEEVELGRDRHRADSGVVGEREVQVVVGRRPSRRAARVEEELDAVPVVVPALSRDRQAAADVEARAR